MGGNATVGSADVRPERSAIPGTESVAADLRRIESALAWAAHELRAPLLEAQLTIDLFVNGGAGERSGESPLALAERTSRLLESLSADLHAILRWGAGSASLQRRRVSLIPLVRAVATEFSRAVVTVSGDPVVALVDRSALALAIRNLIRNAVQHGRPGGEVDVRIRSDSGAAITVADDGPGVPVGMRDTVFLPFARGRRGGSGLGLFIARAIAEAHGGSLRLDPTSVGASFTVRIPADPRPV